MKGKISKEEMIDSWGYAIIMCSTYPQEYHLFSL